MAVSSSIRARPAGVRDALRRMRKEWSAYLFLAPSLLQFTVLLAFPVIFSFYLSFHEWNILAPAKPYVGLDNYVRLFNDARVRQAIFNTLYYTAVSVPTTLFSGLLVALLLNNQIRGRALFRTMYYLPVVTSAVAVAVVWKWIFNGDFGLINYYLIQAGLISEPIRWLTDPNLAMPSIIIVSVWQGVGGCMIIYLAGLQAIPDELFDAAKLDGASELRIYAQVILPLSRPALAAAAIGTFTYSWSDWFWPLIITSSDQLRVLPLAMALFITKNKVVWDILFAGSVLVTLPVMLMFLLFQRQILKAVALSGLK